jgi:hypothetical protein
MDAVAITKLQLERDHYKLFVLDVAQSDPKDNLAVAMDHFQSIAKRLVKLFHADQYDDDFANVYLPYAPSVRLKASAQHTHGMSRSVEYRVWCNMTRYARNHNLTIAKAWRTFEGFWADMGPTHFANARLTKKRGTKSYNAKTCVWK